jgi:hypothetical protein
VFAQRQRLRQAETTVFINGFNDGDHVNDSATHHRMLQGGTERTKFKVPPCAEGPCCGRSRVRSSRRGRTLC